MRRQCLQNLVHRGGRGQATTYDPVGDPAGEDGSIATSAVADIDRSGPAMNLSTGRHGLPKKETTEEKKVY